MLEATVESEAMRKKRSDFGGRCEGESEKASIGLREEKAWPEWMLVEVYMDDEMIKNSHDYSLKSIGDYKSDAQPCGQAL